MSLVMEQPRGATVFAREDRYSSEEIGTNGVYFATHGSLDEAAWEDRTNELRAIRTLPDDWDGEGSVAPSGALVDGAIGLARILQREDESPPDRIIAGVNGTIFFEWYLPVGYREIEVVAPGSAEDRRLQDGSKVPSVLPINWL